MANELQAVVEIFFLEEIFRNFILKNEKNEEVERKIVEEAEKRNEGEGNEIGEERLDY